METEEYPCVLAQWTHEAAHEGEARLKEPGCQNQINRKYLGFFCRDEVGFCMLALRSLQSAHAAQSDARHGLHSICTLLHVRQASLQQRDCKLSRVTPAIEHMNNAACSYAIACSVSAGSSALEAWSGSHVQRQSHLASAIFMPRKVDHPTVQRTQARRSHLCHEHSCHCPRRCLDPLSQMACG